MARGPVPRQDGDLSGCRVLVTRERPGELGRLLAARGADVVHVPLITVVDPPDGGEALRSELARLRDYDWVVVTSPAGAERVGDAVGAHPEVALAAVGTATAQRLGELAGRPVDVVPPQQTAEVLADELNARNGAAMRMLVAQADRATDTLADRLLAGGHQVTTVTAYSTILVEPDLDLVAGADVLVLASGSAAQSWVDAVGQQRAALVPPLVVTIGPSTAAVARELGLKVDGIAADHSLVGLVDEVVRRVVHHGVRDRT